MRISVHAVGRMKAGPEQELAARYFERFARAGPAIGLDFGGVVETVEGKARTADERKREEGERLAAQFPAGAVLILLDERGSNLASQALAGKIGHLRDCGSKLAVFAIGGPDGHDALWRGRAETILSLGAQTWPHQLVRVMLAEQLYRAATILSGHPYHRA